MNETWEALWVNARLATMAPEAKAPYGAVDPGAIAVADEHIAWVGPMEALPESVPRGVRWHDAGGAWITPGLVDCHTHLVYAGSRAGEFEQRLEGVSYEEIARRGGGILSTVKATRAASEDRLAELALGRIGSLLAEGVTTIEIKSGYGLDIDTELRQLRAARRVGRAAPVDVVTTFLGAHLIPPEFAGRTDMYVDYVCKESLPAAAEAGLADAVDAFCERIAFSPAQTERIFEAATALELPVKLHAEQLSDQGGAGLAARFRALSADHLEHVSEASVAAMAEAGTVAVLLPGAFYFLRETKLPPVESFRAHGVPIALSTDSNPGSSPVGSLLLMLSMGCTFFRLTPEEALAGVTRNAAAALGLRNLTGTLEAGKRADFVVWDIEHPAELSYRVGTNPCREVVRAGRLSAIPHRLASAGRTSVDNCA